jgi:phosphoenolpyruvate carboxykinase (GTP)
MKKKDDILQKTCDAKNIAKLAAIKNRAFHLFLADAVRLCAPDRVFVCDDSAADAAFIRDHSAASGEEKPLSVSGHTVHFDGPQDQGRDREVTRYLVPRGETLSASLNQIEREAGLKEVRGLLQDSMKGRTMIVRFLSLGPAGSPFAINCVQCTDSWYVAHCEGLLYRPAYPRFLALQEKDALFCFLHSAGKLSADMVSVEADQKRIYIDHTRDIVYSVNTQYAGNTVGLKKLALRLTIRKADREGWLAEHMFLMGVKGPQGRKTYLAGAFPSACGKTSTAMLPGETILGDDIAYFRSIGGKLRAVNAEAGIFGIIQDVNPAGDPAIYKALSTPGEVIFSNILVKDRKPYWLGMGSSLPEDGVNFTGKWFQGKKDEKGNPVPPAHKNARYTVSLKALENMDPELNNPEGIELGGIMYGGRDAKAYVPVQQGFDWVHGIVSYGASLETETTFAIIGKEGVSEINLMSIQDFVAIPLGKYVKNNLEIVRQLKNPPLVFGVNYFLRDLKDGKFLNAVRDKHVWAKWMELRIHGDAEALRAPTGWIPKYEDLLRLFREVLKKDYTKDDYVRQFTVRVPENLAKIERVEKFHRVQVEEAPAELFQVLAGQRERLLAAQKRFGDYISPLSLG